VPPKSTTPTAPPTLTYVQPLFLEQQHARDVFPRWSILMAGGVFLPAVIVSGIAMELGRRSVAALMPALIIVTFMFGVLAAILRFATATTVVETTALQLRLTIFGWRVWRRTIAIHRIRHVHLTDMTGQLTVLKHGIGELFFMTRKRSVRLHLPEFNYVTIGSSNPAELCDAIRLATSTSVTEAPADSARETHRADPSPAR
jgi:hypothetical protein